MSEIVSVEIIGDSIRYFDRCGGWIERTGGSENWRCNNPGGVKKDSRAGEVSATSGGLHDLAIFETYQDGREAFHSDLNNDKSNSPDCTIGVWVNIHYNDLSWEDICQSAGLDPNGTIGSLTDAQNIALLNAIRQALEWTVGTQSSYHAGPSGVNYQACPGFGMGAAGPGGTAPPPDHTTPNDQWHPPTY